MAGPILKRSDNGVWYIHWTAPGPRGERGRSRRRSTGTTSLDAAKVALAEWLMLEQQGGSGAHTPVVDLWRLYDKNHIDRVAAPETLRASWKNLQRHFGSLTISQVTQSAVDSYVAERGAGRIGIRGGPATCRRELTALLACLRWAAKPRQAYIDPAAVPRFEIPAPAEPRDRWLTSDELARLFAAAEGMRRGDRLGRGERFLWLALETAARKQALFDLTWDRVDFETGVIHLAVPGQAKTKKRRASVPISSRLRPVLERMSAERVNERVLDNGSDIWRTVAGIAARAKVPGVSPHVLRHTAATHMARRGVPLWVIAGILGNTTSMVERVYAKHAPDSLRAGIEQIGVSVVGAPVLRSDCAQTVVSADLLLADMTDNEPIKP